LCRQYLSDPNEDVRVATETLLGELLREIREVTVVRKRYEEHMKAKRENGTAEPGRRAENIQERLMDVTMTSSEHAVFLSESYGGISDDLELAQREDHHSEADGRDTDSKSRLPYH
jgi:vacuole morphology and inheritance protein 14